MENLDDFIKGKLDQLPIEFNDAHWKQAAAMIDEQEKDKHRRFLIWSFFVQILCLVLIFIIIGGGFSFDNNMNSTSADVNIAPIATNDKAIQTIDASINTAPIATNDKTAQAVETDINTVPVATNDKTIQAVETDINTVPVATNDKTIQAVETDINTASIVTNDKVIQVVGTDISSDLEKGARENPQVNPKASKIEINTEIEEKPSIDSPTGLVELDVDPVAIIDNESRFETDDVTQSDPIAIPKDIDKAQFVPVNLLSTDFKYLESDLPLYLKKTTQIYKEKNPFHDVISLYAARTLYPYKQVGAQSLIGYAIGVHYTKNLKQAWSLDVGLHYSLREGTYFNTQTTYQDSFAFKRIRIQHNLQPSQMHSIDLPLAALYTHKRHQFQGGLNYSRLLGLRGDLSRMNDSENATTPTVVKKGWMHDENFKNNRFDLLAAYYFTIKPGLKIGATMHYVLGGFYDKNSTADLHLESKPMFVNIGIRYDIKIR